MTPDKQKRFNGLCTRVEYVQDRQRRGPRLSPRQDQEFDRLIDKALHHLSVFVNLDLAERSVLELEKLLDIQPGDMARDAMAKIAGVRARMAVR